MGLFTISLLYILNTSVIVFMSRFDHKTVLFMNSPYLKVKIQPKNHRILKKFLHRSILRPPIVSSEVIYNIKRYS